MTRIWLLAASLCACGPVEPAGTPGALKEGGFLFCDEPVQFLGFEGCPTTETVPKKIAVGSDFTVSFSDPNGDKEPVLSSPDEHRLELVRRDDFGDASFRASAAGPVTVEARLPSDDRLLDLVRFDLADVQALELRLCPHWFNAIREPFGGFDVSQCDGAGGTSTLEISQGASLAPTVCWFPVDDAGDDLAGHFDYGWTTNDGATTELEIFVNQNWRCATIGGLTQGTATITVSAGTTATGAFDVTVGP